MAIKCGDPILNELGTKYPFLMQLPLCNIYKSFQNHSGQVKNHSFCDSLIEQQKGNFSIIKPICRIAEDILDELKTKLNSPEKNNVSNTCMYLNYWLNDKTKLINRPCENITNLYLALGMHISKNSLSKECPNISDFVVDQNKFKIKKELYFHTENLHWIINKFSSVHVEDKSIYNKYLGECCRFYSKIVHEKYCNGESFCNSELINFRDIFKETRTFLSDKDISISVDEINAFNNPVCPSENGDVRASFGSAGYGTVMDNSHSPDYYDADADDYSSEIETVIVLPVIATIMGILLILLFLYKFTPLGPWLYRIIREKNKILDSLNEQTIGLFHNSRHSNSLSNDLNIHYHST